jgi:O-antigen/teichoic acid export membrane protein
MRWGESVYMPLIAKLSQAQSPDAEKQLRSVCRTVVIYGAVGSAFLAGIGSPFFHALYPYRFALAGTYIEVLAVTTYATFITYLHRRMFLYRGMTRLEATIEGSRLSFPRWAAVMALVRRPEPIEFVALYAVVQVIVYGGLMIVGRISSWSTFATTCPDTSCSP